MNHSRVALLLGCLVSVTAAAVGSGACSSSCTPVAPPPATDSGTPTDGSSGGMDSTMPEGDSESADAGCGNTPSLHASTPGSGVYCPFGVSADGGDLTLNCGADGSTDNLCCVGGANANGSFPPSVCSAGSCTFTATSGNTQIQCEDPATDCPAGNVCCGAASKSHVVGP